MAQTPQRHHWLNVMVGVLDGAFHLTDEEQAGVAAIITRLLDRLHIPDRGAPAVLPIPIVQEMYSNLYSIGVESPRRSNVHREVRAAVAGDNVVSIEAWRAALEGMITTAYPDLAGEERLLLSKVTTDLLAAIGVPNRAAAHVPPAVVTAHRHLDTL